MLACPQALEELAMKRIIDSAILLAGLVFAAIQVDAQVALSTLRGTVSDSSGAVVPNAATMLREPATGVVVRQQATDSQGNFEMLDLKPGSYKLTCEVSGFKPFAADQI